MTIEGRSLVDLLAASGPPRRLAVGRERLLFGIVKIILGTSVVCAFLLWQQALAG